MPDFLADLQHAERTDVGMRRANNQDSHAVVLAEDPATWEQCGHLFMVADGMGAHAAGELASKLAVDGVAHLYRHYRDATVPEALERSLVDTNAEIHRRGQANPDFHAMGTTASALVLSPQGAVVGHVGDSRVYRLRGRRFEQLTFDHSLQWELQAMGQLKANSDLARSVPKNVITRSLGPNPSVVVDLEGPFPLEIGDIFLLCSDGLSGQVQDAEMGHLLAYLSPAEAADVLIDLANLRGGPDNITVLVAQVTGDGLATRLDGTGGATKKTRRPSAVNLAPWVVMGVCFFLAAALWLAEQTVPAGAFAVGGGLSLIVGAFLMFRGEPARGTVVPAGSPLGKGPHVAIDCDDSQGFIETLSGTLNELRDAANEANWGVRWEEFQNLQRQAEEAARVQRSSEAIRYYAQAISFMMSELRRLQNAQASDSSIEYT